MKQNQEYYAVIFTSTRTDNTEGYEEAAAQMIEMAGQQEGFISIEFSQMGDEAITISYWESEQSIKNWKNVTEHLAKQEKGRSTWYKNYRVRVAKVERDYSFES